MILVLRKLTTRFDQKRILQIFKKGGLYFGTSALGLFLSFFTMPIFAKLLSEKDFGIFNYFNNLTGFFAFVFSLQFSSYYSSKYFRCNGEQRKQLTGTLLTFLLLWNPVLILIVYGILVLYCHYIHLTLPYYPFLFFAL
ncbi:MAG TPA: hypothetical protein VL095_12005, partial [Flavisolibacter sp.]|nr:hypothetical protein [Flavisolibacter sp.]